MDLQTALLIIPALIILLLIFPIFVEIRISYNPFFNGGVIALYVFKIKILYYIFSLHGNKIKLENEKSTKIVDIEFSGEKFVIFEEFSEQIKDKMKLKKLLVFYNIGVDDAFSSAMLCGFLNLACLQYFLIVKSKKPTASLVLYDTVSYNKSVCELAVRVEFSISIFDIGYSFLHSFIKRKIQAKA